MDYEHPVHERKSVYRTRVDVASVVLIADAFSNRVGPVQHTLEETGSAVLLPQLKTDEDYPYDERYMSLIAAMTPLSMVFGSMFAGHHRRAGTKD
ncbi:unnamed protein product, partial [Iphiclides podalirius]